MRQRVDEQTADLLKKGGNDGLFWHTLHIVLKKKDVGALT